MDEKKDELVRRVNSRGVSKLGFADGTFKRGNDGKTVYKVMANGEWRKVKK